MTKKLKYEGFKKNLKKKIIENKIYELQKGKTIDDLRNSLAQIQYSLLINLIPINRTVSNNSLNFGVLTLNRDKEKKIEEFNKGIIGLDILRNERILLEALVILVSNTNFQLDIKNTNVVLSKVNFRFPKKIIRELTQINDINRILIKLSRPFILKTNNRGGKYVIDRLFKCRQEEHFYIFTFSKYLAYNYMHKSDNGYARRRGFYTKKRNTIYEALYLELLFTKTAKLKNTKPLKRFEIQINTLLKNINLYNLMHENKTKAVSLLDAFIKASFDLGIFIGKRLEFNTENINRNDKTQLSFEINPDFDWTVCDWNKWNIGKI